MNFPNVKNETLSKNKIEITNLIFIENKLFSLKAKLKVLSIPNDLIFISKLKSEVVEINKEYEEEDVFTLRKFKIKQESYKLIFQSIAKGSDTGYSYLKVFPENKVLDDKVEYKGRIGEININFQNCLDGYYFLNNSDTNICTNLKPKNFFLDEQDKTFKPCPYVCNECYTIEDNNTFYNCLTCYEDWEVTDDKNTCYNYINKNYYKILNFNISEEKDFYHDLKIDQNYLQFTSINYLKKNLNKNKTSINLGICEDILKKEYNTLNLTIVSPLAKSRPKK